MIAIDLWLHPAREMGKNPQSIQIDIPKGGPVSPLRFLTHVVLQDNDLTITQADYVLSKEEYQLDPIEHAAEIQNLINILRLPQIQDLILNRLGNREMEIFLEAINRLAGEVGANPINAMRVATRPALIRSAAPLNGSSNVIQLFPRASPDHPAETGSNSSAISTLKP